MRLTRNTDGGWDFNGVEVICWRGIAVLPPGDFNLTLGPGEPILFLQVGDRFPVKFRNRWFDDSYDSLRLALGAQIGIPMEVRID